LPKKPPLILAIGGVPCCGFVSGSPPGLPDIPGGAVELGLTSGEGVVDIVSFLGRFGGENSVENREGERGIICALSGILRDLSDRTRV
jgi:hypothetical protein